MNINEIEDWLSSNEYQMSDDVERLCNISSGSDDLDGLGRMEQSLVEYMEPLGAACQRIPLPNFEVMDDFGNVKIRSTGRAIRWDFQRERNSSPKKKLLLSIHFDTVYGSESAFQHCERLVVEGEQRIRGPGVIDAKGGIVVLKWTVAAALRFLDLSDTCLSVVLTPDEEIGSPASVSLWEKIAQEFQFAMLYEPTMSDGSMVSHRKGTGTFVSLVRGRSAHSGRNFSAGRNAIVHASKLATMLDELNGRREGVTVNVGRVRGGDAVNVVPDLCILRTNVRVNDAEDETWLRAQIGRIQEELDKPELGFQVKMLGGIHSSPKMLDETTRAWMSVVERAGLRVGQEIRWKGSGGASDGNKLALLGLPNLDTFGPEGDLLHSDQEWIRLASLPKKVKLGLAFVDEWSRMVEK